MISVIVPVYNVEKYLKRCIESILSQTYTQLDVILVDDGSPDACPNICDEYAVLDNRVRVIHKSNGGLSDARNVGLDIARGEWVTFVDSDDWIEPDMYEYLIANAKRNDAEISVGGVNDEFFDGNDTVITKTTYHGELIEESVSGIEAMKKYFFSSWSAWDKIYRREVFDGIRFPIGEINEDEAIVLQLLDRCKKVAYTNKVFYHYIHRPESITTSDFSEKKLAWYRHCKDNLEWVKEHHPELEPYAAKRLCGSVMWSLREISLSDKEYSECNKILLADIETNFKYYFSLDLNRAEKARLIALRWLPFSLYRTIERKRLKNYMRRSAT